MEYTNLHTLIDKFGKDTVSYLPQSFWCDLNNNHIPLYFAGEIETLGELSTNLDTTVNNAMFIFYKDNGLHYGRIVYGCIEVEYDIWDAVDILYAYNYLNNIIFTKNIMLSNSQIEIEYVTIDFNLVVGGE